LFLEDCVPSIWEESTASDAGLNSRAPGQGATPRCFYPS